MVSKIARKMYMLGEIHTKMLMDFHENTHTLQTNVEMMRNEFEIGNIRN